MRDPSPFTPPPDYLDHAAARRIIVGVLLTMMLAYTVLFAWLWLMRMQTEIFDRRARALMMAKGA